jgi:hypothetical protein
MNSKTKKLSTLSNNGIPSVKSEKLNSEKENLKKNLIQKKNEVLESAFNCNDDDDDDGILKIFKI